MCGGIKVTTYILTRILVNDVISYDIGGQYVNAAYYSSFTIAISSTKAIIGIIYLNGVEYKNATGKIYGRK